MSIFAYSKGMDSKPVITKEQELLRDYIRRIIQSTGVKTPSALAAHCGLTASTLNRFLREPVKHILSSRTLKALQDFSGMPPPIFRQEEATYFDIEPQPVVTNRHKEIIPFDLELKKRIDLLINALLINKHNVHYSDVFKFACELYEYAQQGVEVNEKFAEVHFNKYFKK